jgi:hypothetical protein
MSDAAYASIKARAVRLRTLLPQHPGDAERCPSRWCDWRSRPGHIANWPGWQGGPKHILLMLLTIPELSTPGHRAVPSQACCDQFWAGNRG